MTRAPAHRQAGTLFGALLRLSARRGNPGLGQLAVVAVLVLVGGALAVCCCTDNPARSEAGSSATGSAAPELVAHRTEVNQHGSATDTGGGQVLRAADQATVSGPGTAAARGSVLTALHLNASALSDERDGKGLRLAETCGAPAVSDQAGTAPAGRSILSAPGAVTVGSTAPSAPPEVIEAVGGQLLDHFIAQASPYRLCVMRT